LSIVRCALGPLVLFGLLFATAHWEPTGASAQLAGEVQYFPAAYANASQAIEEHVQAF
jgi:hypothetical protein